MALDVNDIIGPLQIDSMRAAVAERNRGLKPGQGKYREPRRITTNVNQPIATTDVASSVSQPFTLNVARRVSVDARDANPLYRQAPADGGIQEATPFPGTLLRGIFGVGVVYRPLAGTPAQRLDTALGNVATGGAGLDGAMLTFRKNDVEELRAVPAQFMDWGPSLIADGAAVATSIGVPSIDRRFMPIRPGLIYGDDEIPLIIWSHRRVAAWAAAFELDFYFLCLESRMSA